VLLNLFRGDAETGYYNAAYNLVFSAVLLSNVLNTSLYPSLVRQASTAPHVLPRVYERVLRYLLLLSLPIALGGWAAADRLVPTLFGSGYEPTVGALQILIWVVPLMFAAEFLGYVVVVQGQESRVARAIMVSTGLNVAINLLLVPRLGLVGAAVMTVVTEAILVAQYVWLLRVLLRGFMWSQVLIRPLVAAVVMAGVVFLLREAPLAVTVLAAGATYAGLLFVLRVIGPDELRFVRRLRGPAMAQEGAAA
jgi:O-antigen/teichoic acid export membrane protein